MKTTIEIASPLLKEAKQLAARDQTTLRALVEEGLRLIVEQRMERRPFELRDASFGGEGLQAGVEEGSWEAVRDLIYDGRGT